jgi:hypothetical protein
MLRDLHESASSAERKQTTMDLGEALFAEHKRTGTLQPLQEMVRTYEQASSEDTLGPNMRCQLAKALIARGAFTGEDADVSHAKAIMDAVELALDSSPSSQVAFTLVSAMHQLTIWRAHQKYTLQDLQRLAEDLDKHLLNPPHPGLRIDLLAACFSVWAVIYPLTTSVDCPSSVVDMAESALDGLVGEHFTVLSALAGFCLNLDVHRNKKPRYMPRVRQLVERMFRAAEDNPISTSYAHAALGNWMVHSYHWSAADYKDSLDVAAVQYRQALSLCPPGHIYRHRYLAGLSCSLINVYSETGARSALNEVVALYDNYADIARRVPPFACNIADAIVARVQAGRLRLESKRILARRATQLLRDLLLATSEANAYYPVLLRRLSGVYFLEISWGSADQSEHLAFARRSVAVGMSTESDVAQLETRLAKVLIIIAQRNSDTTALHEAMSLLERIAKRPVQDFVDYHSSEISWLRARGCMIRYKLLSDDKDLYAAEELFRALCRDPSGCLVGRLDDAFSWADTARYANDEAMEMRAYQHMISTLPQLAYLGEKVATRVEALYLAEGLSCRAASLALTLNDVCGAIEVLEQSRGVVWAQSLRPKAVMDAIPSQYLEAFTGAAHAVEKATDPAERRRHAAQLEALSRQIRQVEGYERFWLTRGYPELKASASFGFIVLVVPSDAFTDVIIIRDVESPPGHLRLPVLKLARLQELAATLKKMCDHSRDSATNGPRGMKMVKAGRAQALSDVEAAYMNALGQLWTELVYPVVADLRLQVKSNVVIQRRPC